MLELMMPRKKAKSPSPGKTADVITGHSPAKANLARRRFVCLPGLDTGPELPRVSGQTSTEPAA